MCDICYTTGTFSLSLSAVCIAGSFHNKLGWATMLANQKDILFTVEDSTLATEFGPLDSVAVIGRGAVDPNYNHNSYANSSTVLSADRWR